MIYFYSCSVIKEIFVYGDAAAVGLTTTREFDLVQSQISVLPLGKFWATSLCQKIHGEFN